LYSPGCRGVPAHRQNSIWRRRFGCHIGPHFVRLAGFAIAGEQTPSHIIMPGGVIPVIQNATVLSMDRWEFLI
jgi:hypothetical protein